jgi:hypothetical protein
MCSSQNEVCTRNPVNSLVDDVVGSSQAARRSLSHVQAHEPLYIRSPHNHLLSEA